MEDSMRIKSVVCNTCLAVALATMARGQPPLTVRETGIKYVRDSEEYATLARQVYRVAGEVVTREATRARRGAWAVVLDVDETALDNSAYQLERAAYAVPFDAASWSAWVDRREALVVPGVVGFVDLVRRAGGHVAWITNRDASLADATRANLKAVGLWGDNDRLCAQKTPQHTKADRRREVVTGKGDCSWPDTGMQALAFVGDQLGDFPDASENIPQSGTDAAFGRTCFLLPNPMYGAWTTRVTRVGPRPGP
jgi:5'-nucleotidase (lipoprotein e(P4) family)